MRNITTMNRGEILEIRPNSIRRMLSPEEILHIFKTMGAFWAYDYAAAKDGLVGMHAELKSGRCSDGFLNFKEILKHQNVRQIFSHQVILKILPLLCGNNKPDYIAGIPDGATKMGEDICQALRIANLQMAKVNDKIVPIADIKPGSKILLVEDFCTRGTAFINAVEGIKLVQPDAVILPFYPVIINRGGMESVIIEELDKFEIVPLVHHRINDWEPEKCPLCKIKSVRIKPKATEENWVKITTSQISIQ